LRENSPAGDGSFRTERKDRMKWLVVGTGDIATKRVMPALAADRRCTIAAVCDVSAERAGAAAGAHNARAYTDFDKALSRSDVEAVYIATPIFLHTPQAAAALDRGKHVIVEKPAGLNYAEARNLASVAERAQGKCAVAYFRRFYERYRMVGEMLSAGEFGQVVLVRMTYFSWFNPARDDSKYWRVEPDKAGGGPLADMGTHMFDVMIGLLGLPDSVFAKAETITHDYEAEDSAAAIMKYRGGPHVVASFNWNSRTWSHEFEVIGTEAKVKWHPYDGPRVVKTVGRDIQELEMPNHENVHFPLIKDFVDCVEEGAEPRTSAAEAAKTNLLLEAVYRSSRLGREVSISEVMTPGGP